MCDPATDTNQSSTSSGTLQDNTTYKTTATYTCRGTYKAGKLSYTELSNSTKTDFSDGLSCQSNSSFTYIQLDGAFTDGNTASGNYNAPAYPLNCSKGGANSTINEAAETGTWTATLV